MITHYNHAKNILEQSETSSKLFVHPLHAITKAVMSFSNIRWKLERKRRQVCVLRIYVQFAWRYMMWCLKSNTNR